MDEEKKMYDVMEDLSCTMEGLAISMDNKVKLDDELRKELRNMCDGMLEDWFSVLGIYKNIINTNDIYRKVKNIHDDACNVYDTVKDLYRTSKYLPLDSNTEDIKELYKVDKDIYKKSKKLYNTFWKAYHKTRNIEKHMDTIKWLVNNIQNDLSKIIDKQVISRYDRYNILLQYITTNISRTLHIVMDIRNNGEILDHKWPEYLYLPIQR